MFTTHLKTELSQKYFQQNKDNVLTIKFHDRSIHYNF